MRRGMRTLRYFMKGNAREDGFVDARAKEMFNSLAHSLGYIGGNRSRPALRTDHGRDIFDIAIKVSSFEVEGCFALVHHAAALWACFLHFLIFSLPDLLSIACGRECIRSQFPSSFLREFPEPHGDRDWMATEHKPDNAFVRGTVQ